MQKIDRSDVKARKNIYPSTEALILLEVLETRKKLPICTLKVKRDNRIGSIIMVLWEPSV